ncbi:uncharacterized protein LOC107364067 [Tetranychus urticae]|uniref:Uncharacterized protein n=1 Tax=Tetranychus urticae TaxID=32264 RepID=T1KHM6_TETUR|nr:uncharacterized protein LOC107364067 [Tetranychus urticae]
MEDLDSQLDVIFNEITSTLTEKHKFTSKVVEERVSRLKKFTKKADKVYFNYFKNCVDHFLNEEVKIYDEVSANLNEDEELTAQILKTCSEIEETIDDTRKILGQSHELSKGIETINKRIQSHEQLQSLIEKLNGVIEESESIVSMKHQEEAIVEDEM